MGAQRIGRNRGAGNGRTADGNLHTLEISDITSPVSQAVLQETRLRIMAVLSSAEAWRRNGYSLQELGQILDCSPQNAHHHLRILANINAVQVTRSEATQRIPRQFWISNVRAIRLRPFDGGSLDLDLGASDTTLTRLDRELRKWAKAHGSEEAHPAALSFSALLLGMEKEAANELLAVLQKRVQRGS